MDIMDDGKKERIATIIVNMTNLMPGYAEKIAGKIMAELFPAPPTPIIPDQNYSEPTSEPDYD